MTCDCIHYERREDFPTSISMSYGIALALVWSSEQELHSEALSSRNTYQIHCIAL